MTNNNKNKKNLDLNSFFKSIFLIDTTTELRKLSSVSN